MSTFFFTSLAVLGFFALSGMQNAFSVYRKTLRELGIPPLRIQPDQWFGLSVAIPLLAVLPGALLLFVPKFIEKQMLVGVVVALQSEGAITETQALEYLQTKGILI